MDSTAQIMPLFSGALGDSGFSSDPLGLTGDTSAGLPPMGSASGTYGAAFQAPLGYAISGGLQSLQDGTSLASGWSADGVTAPVLIDFNSDGSTNASFGVNGVLTAPSGTTWISNLSLGGADSTYLGSLAAASGLNSIYGGSDQTLNVANIADVIVTGPGITVNFTANNYGDTFAGSIATGDNSTLNFPGFFSGSFGETIVTGANSNLNFSGYEAGGWSDGIVAGQGSTLDFSGMGSAANGTITAGDFSSLSFGGAYAGTGETISSGVNSTLAFDYAAGSGSSIAAGSGSSLVFSGDLSGSGDTISTGDNATLTFMGSLSGGNDVISLGANALLVINDASQLASDTITQGADDTLIIQNDDGSEQLMGGVTNPDGSSSFFFEQLTASGQPDTTFGGGTGALTSPDGVSFTGNFSVLSGGDILAGAVTTDGTFTPVLVDYNADGSINTAFGANGEIVGTSAVAATNGDGSSASANDGSACVGDTTGSGAYGTFSLIPVDPIVVIDPMPVLFGFSNTVSLLNEDFSNGDWQAGTIWQNNGVGWNWQLVSGDVAPTEYESYSAYGAPDRGMPSQHGGFEVASSGNDGSVWQVAADITLPYGTDLSQPAVMSFDAGYRDQVTNGQFEVYDVTKGADLLTPQAISGEIGTWTTNTFNVDLSGASAGDSLEVRWIDSANNSWSGLEVGAVSFEAQAIQPQPPSGYQLDGVNQILQDGTALTSALSTDGTYTPVLVDYNADGTINQAFGKDGVLTGPTGATYLWATQTDSGSLLVQGGSILPDGQYGSFLEQFTASGQLDTTFGGGTGSLTAPDDVSFSGNFSTLANGNRLASAVTTDGTDTPVIVAYNADGTVNTAFGSNGEIVAPAGVTSESFYLDPSSGDLAVTDLVITGTAYSDTTTFYTADGQPDPNQPAVTATYSAVYENDGSYGTIFPVAYVAGSSSQPPVAESTGTGLDTTGASLRSHEGSHAPALEPTRNDDGSGAAAPVRVESMALADTQSGFSDFPVNRVVTVASQSNQGVVPRETTSAPAASEPGTLVVAPSFDPSAMGGGIASISALKLAAAEASDSVSDEDQEDQQTASASTDAANLPSYNDLPSSNGPAGQDSSSEAPVSDEATEPESRLASDEEVIAALMLAV